MKIKIGTWLTCGCCGLDFQTWDGYEDQDQDRDYGICNGCQHDANARNREYEDKVLKLVSDNLNDDNKALFETKSREDQLRICRILMENGTIKWSIGGKSNKGYIFPSKAAADKFSEEHIEPTKNK